MTEYTKRAIQEVADDFAAYDTKKHDNPTTYEEAYTQIDEQITLLQKLRQTVNRAQSEDTTYDEVIALFNAHMLKGAIS